MKKDEKSFIKWATDILQKAQEVLLLNDFYPLILEKSDTSACECQYTYPYKTTTIRYSNDALDQWQKGNISYAKKILVHEMCHKVTDGLYSKAVSVFRTKDEVEDEREMLTDHIANIIMANGLI